MRLARKGVLRFGAAALCGGLLCSGPASAQTVQRAVEDAFWESVKGCTSAGEVEAYLKEFPKGRYVGKARACLARLRKLPLHPGTAFRDCPACPEMVVVPAGKFTMGSPKGEKGRQSDEGPQRRVTIRRPFAVGSYEVTRGEFARFVKATGHSTGKSCSVWSWRDKKWNLSSGLSWRNPGFEQTDRHPVACVNWHDAQAYVRWLSRRTGKRYRLLSEAEWEYAARAGTTTRYHWGDAVGRNLANCKNCGSRWDGKRTAPVGSFAPNGFGLHDMHGNMWERVADCWYGDHVGAPSDGSASITGRSCSYRVRRGGSWDTYSLYTRAARRRYDFVQNRTYDVGFRVARTLSP